MIDYIATRRTALAWLAAGVAMPALAACARPAQAATFKVTLTEAQWKARLSPAAYDVLRHEGTEPAFSSPLLNEHRKGTFVCAGCSTALFDSATKYDSGTGWPSFWKPLPGGIGTTTDHLLGYARTAVHCATCGGHLGHVFDDGPKPTGLRYCMDGVAMKFRPA